MRVLIVEKQKIIDGAIKASFAEFKFQSDIAESLQDGEYYIDIRNYDLVLVDLDISTSSFDFISTVRDKFPKITIFTFADKADKYIEIKAFKNGADDFVKKPFDIDVLMARIMASLKLGTSSVITIGEFTISPDEERISFKDEELDLKGKPFEVLAYLARHKDQVVSKEQLLDSIWEEPELVTPNVIEVAINQIRQKVDRRLGIDTIETVRRRGYRFSYPVK